MLIKIIFLGCLGIITVYSFVAVLYYLNRKKKEKKCTCKTYGKITNNIRHEEIDAEWGPYTVWNSLYEYTVGDTKCVKKTHFKAVQPREVGKIVTVYYNPNNCHESYIEGDNNSSFYAIVSLFLGISLVIFIYFIIFL